MRKSLTLLSFLLAFSVYPLLGQNFSGRYIFSRAGETLTLVLQQDAKGTITGTLSSTKGTQYKIEGEIEEELAVGLCSSDQGAVYFEAEIEGNTLNFTMIELDENNEPKSDQFQPLQFVRQTTAAGGVRPDKPQEQQARDSGAQPPSTVHREAARGTPARAADTVNDSQMGISFAPPAGWKAQKQEGGYILGSTTHKGFILIMGHSFSSLGQMNEEASQGLVDENQGIELRPSTVPQPFQKNGLAAEFDGFVQGREARAFAIGLLSPQGGGVTILAAVEKAGYTEAYPQFVRAIASSLVFSAPQADSSLMRYFAGKYYSYSSGSTLYGSAGTERQVMLCPNGVYFDSYEFSASGAGGGQNWGGAQQKRGAARWSIRGNKSSGVITIISPSGETREVRYQVTGEDGVLLIDGIKFAFAGAAECDR
jgi:hypothetical protein